jgi:type III restriction enzyme
MGINSHVGADTSEKIWGHLFDAQYIDKNGKVQDKLRTDIKDNKVNLPEELQDYANQITATLKKVAGNLNIKNADDRKPVALNKAVFLGEEFKQLWDRIKYKTTFRVNFDIDALVNKCVDEIKKNLSVKQNSSTKKVLQKLNGAALEQARPVKPAMFMT